MTHFRGFTEGFTLVELISVIVLISVLAVNALPKLIPSASYQLQGSRDTVLAAFFSAQQMAMSRDSQVQLSFGSGAIDIRRDDDNSGTFESSESVTISGQSYPVSLLSSQSISSATFVFDRLGQPNSAATLSLTQSGRSVSIVVTETGYAY